MTSSSRLIVVFGGCTTGGYAGDCAGKQSYPYSPFLYLIVPYLILSFLYCLILSYLILSYLILSYLILSYLILSYLVLSYLIISYLILSYFILSYLILFFNFICFISSYSLYFSFSLLMNDDDAIALSFIIIRFFVLLNFIIK